MSLDSEHYMVICPSLVFLGNQKLEAALGSLCRETKSLHIFTTAIVFTYLDLEWPLYYQQLG